ncbi:MAG TPA: outer membrane beta-barrel protein [Chthoniobacterales bacterium]
MPRPSAILLFLACVSTTAVFAQTNPTQAVDRAELLRNQQPTLREETSSGLQSEGVAPSSPNDPDLGKQALLKRAEEYQPWTIVVSAPISYTSNVALSSTNEQGDVLFTPSAAFSYAPRLTRTLYANFVLAQQMFYYRGFEEFDFGSFDARAGLSYSIPQAHDLILRGSYDFNRLTNEHFTEFFNSHTLDFSAEVPFRIGRAQQISVGADLAFNLASDPAPPGRNEYSVFASYTAALARNFTINGVFRIAARDYTDVDRLDVSEIIALNATYQVAQWLTLNAVFSYAHNGSDHDVFDYNVINTGAGVSAVFRF